MAVAEIDSRQDEPTIELLEFLGEWQSNDGEWIDPDDLADADFIKLFEITDSETESLNKGQRTENE